LPEEIKKWEEIVDIRTRRFNLIMLSTSIFLAIIFTGLHILSKIYVINVTPSIPLGIYKLEKFDGVLKKGDLVVYEVDDKYKNLTSIKRTMFKSVKPVAAFYEDKVEIKDNRIYVNGEDYGEIFSKVSSNFNGKMKEDEVLTLSKVRGTFDGRYYGAIKKSKIEKKARLIYELRI
jgi:type IV secretory pathway protease traF-like protein